MISEDKITVDEEGNPSPDGNPAEEKTDALAIIPFPISELRKCAKTIQGVDYISREDFATICNFKDQQLHKKWQRKFDFGIIHVGVGNKVHYRFNLAIAFLYDYHQMSQTLSQTDTFIERTKTKSGTIERRRTQSVVLQPPVRQKEFPDLQEIVVRPRGRPPTIKPTDYSIDEARRAFRLLDEGIAPGAIVQKLKLHPITVESIWKDWTALRSGFVVEGTVRTTIEMILRELMVSVPKPMATQADLRDNLLAMKHQVFSEDEVKRATHCARCIHKGKPVVNKAEVCLRCANDISDQLLFKEGLKHRKTPNFETYFHQEKGARK